MRVLFEDWPRLSGRREWVPAGNKRGLVRDSGRVPAECRSQ